MRINESYAPLESKCYNRSYLVKLCALPECDPKVDTLTAIINNGVQDVLETLDIKRVPSPIHKKLLCLFRAYTLTLIDVPKNVAVHLDPPDV